MITPKFKLHQIIYAFMNGRLQAGPVEEIETHECIDEGKNRITYSCKNINSWVDEDEAFNNIEELIAKIQTQSEGFDPNPKKKTKWQEKLDQMAQRKMEENKEQLIHHSWDLKPEEDRENVGVPTLEELKGKYVDEPGQWVMELLYKRGWNPEVVNKPESKAYIMAILESGKFEDVRVVNEWEAWATSVQGPQFNKTK